MTVLGFGRQKQMMMVVDPMQDSRAAQDFIMLLRMVCDLNLQNFFFLEFSISYFQRAVHFRQLKGWKAKPWIRGNY